MYVVEFAFGSKQVKYRYLVGPYTVAIIPPSRKKHITSIAAVRDAAKGFAVHNQNGTADGRIAAEEIVSYVIKHRIL